MGSSMSIDSFGAKDSLEVNGTTYAYYRLDKVPGQERLPYSLKEIGRASCRERVYACV